ncbi:alpha/beta hydrolase family protein [Nocardia sp. NPDC127526]|uniref:alpha/beta hydrolase family protein n=1 Tax=Nocardia sp. NPDC127526 TaxID=3345393 RepID=UPI00362B7C5A
MFNRLAVAALSAAAVLTTGTGVTAAAPIGVTVLPRPAGELPVGTTTLHLVDHGRADPFQPDRARELMVSVFYPATGTEQSSRARYLSTQLIPDLEKQIGFQAPGLFTNSYTDAPALAGASYPVILYSPGAGVTRLLGTGLAEELASRGYVVVTVDPTYEAPVVEFPGGRLVRSKPFPAFTPEVRQQYTDARLGDFRFVLDSLTRLASGANPDAGNRALPNGLGTALDLEHIGAVGHSLGGYIAVEAMHDDERIDAAVDLDGQIGVDENFGRSVTEGTREPVLVMTSAQIEEAGDGNPSLDAFWRNSTGWKRHLVLNDAAHYDFTDMPLLVPAVARSAAAKYIGAIPAERGSSLVRTYVAAMFDKFLRDRTDTVLDRPVGDPEITVLK